MFGRLSVLLKIEDNYVRKSEAKYIGRKNYRGTFDVNTPLNRHT